MDDLEYGRSPMVGAIEALNEFHKLPLAEQQRIRSEWAVEFVHQQMASEPEA